MTALKPGPTFKRTFIRSLYVSTAITAVWLIVLNLPQPVINRMATAIAKHHCTPLSAADTITTPHALLGGAFNCVADQRFDDAVRIALMAAAYMSFDLLRLQDNSKVGPAAIASLRWLRSLMSDEQRSRYAASENALRSNPVAWQAFCDEMNHIGPPTYYPQYLAYLGPLNDAQTKGPVLKTDFDAKQTWRAILTVMSCKI